MVRLCVEGYVCVSKDAFVNIKDAFMYTQYMLVRTFMSLRNVCQCAHVFCTRLRAIMGAFVSIRFELARAFVCTYFALLGAFTCVRVDTIYDIPDSVYPGRPVYGGYGGPCVCPGTPMGGPHPLLHN